MIRLQVSALALLASLFVVGCKPLLIGPGERDFSFHLAGDYFLTRASPSEVIIAPLEYDPSQTRIIPKTVSECGTDGTWIVAKRKILTEGSRPTLDSRPEDYWILNVVTKKLLGPLTESEFIQARAEEGVPDDIRLTDVYELREKY